MRSSAVNIGIMLEKIVFRLAQQHLTLPQPLALHDEIGRTGIDNQEQGLGMDTAENEILVFGWRRKGTVQQQNAPRR